MKRIRKTVQLLIIVSFFLTLNAHAQVTATVSVMPPYPVNIEDYANQTTVIVTAMDMDNVQCYLRISITGDNGIELNSLIDYPYPRFTLYNVTPLTITGPELYDHFQLQNLGVTGISKAELQENGLPPGNYQICIQVFTADDGMQVSGDPPAGCSGNFTIDPLSVNISTQVLPPFTEDVESYTNKTLVTLQANRPGNVTLRFSIVGDNGIRLETRPDFLPSEVITISSVSPQIITSADMYEYFQQSSWIVSGISYEELWDSGLPQGNYRICVTAYEDNELVSLEEPGGCSNSFSIDYLDPPILITPYNEIEIEEKGMQNIIFSWTPSPGAPPWTQYTLKLVEIMDPYQDPNDAMLSATTPPFFETEVTGATSFLYGPAQPILEPGLRYAFQVIASDAESNRKFQNYGKSEVFWFTYGEKEEMTPMSADSVVVNLDPPASYDNLEDFEAEFEKIPFTTLNGRMFCKYPDYPGVTYIDKPQQNTATLPSGNTTITLPTGSANQSFSNTDVGSAGRANKSLKYSNVAKAGGALQSNANGLGMMAGTISDDLEFSSTGTISGVTELRKQPYYYFGSTEEMVNTRPLANVRLRLVGRIAYVRAPYAPGEIFALYQDHGPREGLMKYTDLKLQERHDSYKVINVVLDVTDTDENGNFTFNFNSDFFTGSFSTGEFKFVKQIDENVAESPFDILEWGMDEGIDEVYTGLNKNMLSSIMAGNGIEIPQSEAMKVLSGGGHELINRGGYICLKIEVENPKFCSPDIDVFMMPGDNLTIPPQVAKLKTYDLMVSARACDTLAQAATSNELMENVNIKILRDKRDLSDELDLILDYEGQKLNTETINPRGTFKNVSVGKTGLGAESTLYFKNLVRHNPDDQYWIELSTRDTLKANIEYDYEASYNYKTIFEVLPTQKDNDAKNYLYESPYPSPCAVYNHQYVVPMISAEYVMKPLPPEIKGRVLSATNIVNSSLANVRVELLDFHEYRNHPSSGDFNNDYSSMKYFANNSVMRIEEHKDITSPGIFRFTGLDVDVYNSSPAGPYRKVYISCPTYKSVLIPGYDGYPWNLERGSFMDISDVQMEAADSLKGFVEDEDGNPVVAYVKTSYSPFYKTELNTSLTGQPEQVFNVPAQETYNHIYIHPRQEQYFKTDTLINVVPKTPLKIVVYKKLHRPVIIIKDNQGNVIPDVKVKLDKYEATTGGDGFVKFKFAAESDQFVLTIIPPKEFTPIQKTISVPVSPKAQRIVIILDRGNSIYGKITDSQSGTTISNARIYAELSSMDGNVLYIEDSSDRYGNYRLSGIPKTQTNLTVHVVKTGSNPTYEGLVENITFHNTSAITNIPPQPHDFSLKRLEGWNIDKIWGFPVAVEKFVADPLNTEIATISGYLYDLPMAGSFSLQQSDLHIPFQNVKITKSGATVEPVNSSFSTTINNIPLIVNNTFAANLYNKSRKSNTPGLNLLIAYNAPLEVYKGMNGGAISGMVELDAGSYTSLNLSREMYIGHSTTNSKTTVFSGATTLMQIQSTTFNVFSLGSDLEPMPVKDYKVYGFNADAVLGPESNLQGNKINLATTLHTNIQTCTTCSNLDLKINVGSVRITNNTIDLIPSANDTLNFDLEEWKVYNQGGWVFNKDEEAIVLDKVLIVTTKGITATVRGIRIRPDYLAEGSIDIAGGGLSLGGVANIKLSPNITPLFNYDSIGHYRISLVGNLSAGEPAGYIDNLPAMASGDRIEFKSIGLLSNNKEVLSIEGDYLFHDIMNIRVTSITSGNGFFVLKGMPDPGVPDLTPSESGMRYALEDGKIVAKFLGIQGNVECPGNVVFELDSQRLTAGKYMSYGTFHIASGTGKRKFDLRGLLEKTKNDCVIKVIKVDGDGLYEGNIEQNMVVGNNTFKVYDGLIQAVNSADWGELEYYGNSSSIDGLNEKVNNFKFVVHGSIGVSTTNVEFTNINVGFGEMSLVYDFDENILTGSLEVHNIQLGYAVLESGILHILFDNKGFYLAGSVYIRPLNLVGVQGAFVIGNSDAVRPEHTAGLLNNFDALSVPKLNAIHGSYAIGQLNLVDIKLETPFLDILSVRIKAGAGMYFLTDLDKHNEIVKIGGYIFGNASGGFSLRVCKFSVDAGAKGGLEGTYDFSKDTISLDGCAEGYIKVNACKYNTGGAFRVDLNCSYNGSFKVGGSIGWKNCQ